MKKKIHVKTGDTVMVISGKDRGKKGKVLEVSPEEGKVIVEGVKIVKKHMKPRKAGDPSGIVKIPSAMYSCKVMPYCSGCQLPVRIKHNVYGDGNKERVCARCGNTL